MACQDLNLVKRIDSVLPDLDDAPPAGDKVSLLKTYTDVFHGIGTYERPYDIQLREDVTPVVEPARRFHYAKGTSFRQPCRGCKTGTSLPM